jgi:hypothetical protein
MGFMHEFFARNAANRASRQAAQEAHRADELQAAKKEFTALRAPHIQDLVRCSGRLVLVTNPGGEHDLVDQFHAPIANAIVEAVPEATEFYMSTHVNQSPQSGQGIGAAGKLLARELGRLTNRSVSPPKVAFVNFGYGLEVATLAEVGKPWFEDAATRDEYLAHIAITSALGIVQLNLDYDNAKYGDTFLLDGQTSSGDLQWQKIFQSPWSGNGEHHIVQ